MLKKFLDAIKPYIKVIAIGLAGFVAYKMTEGQFEEAWIQWSVVAGVAILGGMLIGNLAEGLIDNITKEDGSTPAKKLIRFSFRVS